MEFSSVPAFRRAVKILPHRSNDRKGIVPGEPDPPLSSRPYGSIFFTPMIFCSPGSL